MKHNAAGVFHKTHSLNSIGFRTHMSHECAATLIGMCLDINGCDDNREDGQKFAFMYNTQSSDRDGNPWTAALPPMVPASPSNSFQPQTPVNPTNLSFGSVLQGYSTRHHTYC
jgi:hypothetical protein